MNLGLRLVALALFIVAAGCAAYREPNVPQSVSDVADRRSPSVVRYRLLHSFDIDQDDGEVPYSKLARIGSLLYGTTSNGGAKGGNGTVFQVSASGEEKTLYVFRGSVHGARPLAGMIAIKGTLYGTTLRGGSSGKGVVFALTTSGKETVLYSFKGGADGALPAAPLINVGGTLYGTTSEGGSKNLGTVFSVTMDGQESVLHSFTGGTTDGANPVSALVATGGLLYGTTQYGGGASCTYGASRCGTVFSMTKSGTETVLYQFKGADGAMPRAGLIVKSGVLYGTAYEGGSAELGAGTVFSITKSGKLSVLHIFEGPDGGAPQASLCAANGVFYGTTVEGGGSLGSIFQIDATGKERVLHRFNQADGQYPRSAVLLYDGSLFGVTELGGVRGAGTIYKLVL